MVRTIIGLGKTVVKQTQSLLFSPKLGKKFVRPSMGIFERQRLQSPTAKQLRVHTGIKSYHLQSIRLPLETC